MILSNKQIKRICIYFFYDENGVVDKYIVNQIQELKKDVSHIMFVSNGTIAAKNKEELQGLVDSILERDNTGFDVWAYKEAMESIGWDNLSLYDELILMNYTMFGPIYPFSEMFSIMNKRDLDFWGITKHHKVSFDCFHACELGYIPEHIQSSFMVIRKNMIKSNEFQSYWKNICKINSYADSIGKHEAVFTKKFVDIGFKADVYINTDDLEGYTRYPLMLMADELIIKRRCPVMKVKSFAQNYYDFITDTVCNATIDTIEFIEKHTDYDTDLIWACILRKFHMSDIKKLLHLNYILPKNINISQHDNCNKKVVLIMHLYYEDLLEESLKYASFMPSFCDLIITTPKEAFANTIKEAVNKLQFNDIKVLTIENRGRDVSSLLVAAHPYIFDYDLACFVHDKKTTQIEPYANGTSFSYKCFENTLGSREFILNVIDLFNQHPRLGMLMPPPPNHGHFYQIIGSEWASNYENTISLLHSLGITMPVHWSKEPISPLGTMFWFRPNALKTLYAKEWNYQDFPKEPNKTDGTILHAVERAYGLVCQYEGYYPAWVMTDNFARIEITNLQFMMREINSILFQQYFTSNLLDMTEKMKARMLFDWKMKDRTVLGHMKYYTKKILPEWIWLPLRKVYRKVFNKK